MKDNSKENQFIILKSNILQDKNLNASDKLVLGYIYSYLVGGCSVFASNSEIANFLGLSRLQVIRSIKKLHDLGYFMISHSRALNIPGNDIRVIDKKLDNFDVLGRVQELLSSKK